MIARRKELFAQHRCRPWLTMLIPPLTQLPVFVGTSMFLSRLSQPPSAFDAEAFLTLTSLAHPDPTATLPIALGVITLANVESSRWFVSTEARVREEKERKRVDEQRAQGRIVLEPRKIVQSGLRLLSVGRILIGAVVPGVRANFNGFFIIYDWHFLPIC
jgi:mitochondrial inner membrane protein COX18